ncbi:MAG: pyridoxal-phosphate dependent enzyme [Bacteroidota bacterium]
MWHDSVLGTIGNTPLVRLNRLALGLPCTVLAKVEFFNPGGSVKDRIAQSMIEAAEAEGQLKPGGTIIEGTSGNTGAGLALVAIAKGYRCIFTTTDKQSQEKVDVLRALGAEVIVCPNAVEPTDPRSYYSVARRLAEEIPNSVYLNQYDNPSNAEAHFKTTGPELWAQTEGRITHYIAGAGTGGTISGTGRYLKTQQPNLTIVGVDPYGSVYYKYFHSNGEFDHDEIYPYLTEGVGEDIIAQNMNFDILDDYVRVTDKEAMQMTRRLAREEGLFVGQSCGMAVAGGLQWLHTHKAELTADDVVVIVLPDSGFRYLSKTYNDTWMRDHGFLERRTDMTAAQILAQRRNGTIVVGVSPGDTVEHAIHVMAEHEISQMPVLDDGHVVGSLNENGLLNRLIENPTVREQAVDVVMGEPLAIVPRGLHLDMLTAYLDEGPGAVLVEAEGGDGFAILTRSDLIRALAKAGRSRN